MDFEEYQARASETDQFPSDNQRGVSISLFGLMGEIGSLLTSFKKRLRDKGAYRTFDEDVKEEMGDVLWY
ncbi:MAG: nucleoside triphosphate pyrophosphohydrolase family protein, partial [Gammaproteobacteria bacterium]|nr:nucleoside triphosphate pyrophosphohydrolase family protein [Gammaproteobacteria bacterium]